jgi:hypothetical protein
VCNKRTARRFTNLQKFRSAFHITNWRVLVGVYIRQGKPQEERLTAQARVRSNARPCGTSGGKSASGTDFYMSILVFPLPCQYYLTTNSPYSFLHLFMSSALQFLCIWGCR